MSARFDPAHPAVDLWLDRSLPSLNLVASAISATIDPGMIVLGGRLPTSLASRIAERIRFKPYCLFLLLWITLVYCPLAHCVWAMDWWGDCKRRAVDGTSSWT